MTSTNYEGYLDEENLLLELGNGTTYVSKLSSPYIVHAQYIGTTNANTSVSSVIRPAISGRTITFHVTGDQGQAGVTGVTAAYVTIKGRK